MTWHPVITEHVSNTVSLVCNLRDCTEHDHAAHNYRKIASDEHVEVRCINCGELMPETQAIGSGLEPYDYLAQPGERTK